MRKIFKLLMVVLIVVGITLSVLNFISVDNMASFSQFDGTLRSDGECAGRPLDC
jgi:hypothetical protein